MNRREKEGTVQKIFQQACHKPAFTLAEVLITLGIIGVVAALTIPNVTSHYRKKVAETRLAKFYTVMNQAVQMSEKDNGPKEYWEKLGTGYDKNDEETAEEDKGLMPEVWFNKYLKPYIKYTNLKINGVTNKVMVYFADGSLCVLGGGSFQFWPEAGNFVDYRFDEDSAAFKNNAEISGIKYFTFHFNPYTDSEDNKYHYKKGVEPYKNHWDGTVEMLKESSSIGCRKEVSNERAYCAALIQQNGWKIPDDYPLKF